MKNPEVERQGLTSQQLEKDVISRLMQAGIMATTSESITREKRFNGSTLLIMHFVKDSPYVSGDCVTAELNQDVRLERDRSIELSVATWERIDIVSNPRGTPSQAKDVRKRIMDLVDKFINDYGAANP